MLQELLHDVRYAARSLRAAPTFTTVAVLILALGIGANAIVFTLVNTLFFSTPVGIQAPHELVRVTRIHEQTQSGSFGYPDYVYVRDQNRTLAGIVGFEGRTTAATLALSPDAEPLPVDIQLVTSDYFEVLGVPMALGRGFGPEQSDLDGDGMALVVSHGFWRTALGGDLGIVGETVFLNDRAFRILGVALEGFRGVGPLDQAPTFWAPVTAQPVLHADSNAAALRRVPNERVSWLASVGRLAPGVTVEQARADLQRVNQELMELFPDGNEGLGIGVWESYGVQPVTHERMIELSQLLGGVVGLVLVIVCANIAVLQLARAAARQREVGIRFAIGAGRGRVLRQLLTESILLSTAGAVGGFALAFQGSRIVGAWLPLPGAVEFRPDFKVLVFSLAVAALVALAFGLAPALSATRSGGLPAVQSRAVIGGGNRLRTALVVIQVALSVVLVLGATLFVRSLLVAQSVDPGFATRGRVFVSTSTRPAGYTHEEQNALVDEVLARLRARPEVERASVSVMVPFRGTWSRDLDPTGSGDEEAPQIEVLMNAVGPDYFEAMGMTLLAGRGIEPGDRAADGSVLVVNETMAETLWPGESPVGKTLAMSSDEAADRVIGLVADADYQSLGEDPQPVAYASTYQVPFPRLIFVASTRGDARSLSRAVQEEIRAVDRNLPIARVDTIEEAIETQIGTYRLGARAVGTFGVLAAVLAAFGLYGVLSYVVASGTREIGIRMALGATGSGMLRAVVVNGLRMASIGIALGLAVALLSARVLAGMLYGIEPHDPLTFVLVPLGLLLIALVASAMPARRASGIDPVEALRAD